MIDFSFTIAPSGHFVSTKGYHQGTSIGDNHELWNPGLYDHLRGSFKLEHYEPTTKALGSILKTEHRLIQQSDFDRYGETLVELAKSVSNQSANLNLGLLRGAFRPCSIVEVMTRTKISYDFLDYTQHAEREPEIRPKLLEAIIKANTQEEEFRIQITDTAIGGYGSTHFAEMLIGIKELTPQFRLQRWKVSFNLLHDNRTGTNTRKMKNIEALSGDLCSFDVTLFQVSDLITEDYDGGLGLRMDGNILKPCHEPGTFLLESKAGISLITSEDLGITFDHLFTQSVTDGLVTSPDYNQVGDIWNRWD